MSTVRHPFTSSRVVFNPFTLDPMQRRLEGRVIFLQTMQTFKGENMRDYYLLIVYCYCAKQPQGKDFWI